MDKKVVYTYDIKILYLSLKSEWYNMIESGIKKEEYREIKDFWTKRLVDKSTYSVDDIKYKKYDVVCFSYGYTKRKMYYKIKSIGMGIGKEEWGASKYPVYIIKLGERCDFE